MRLSVAVWPPGEVLDVLDALERPEESAIRWSTREQWHVTLRFLGEVPDADVPELLAAFGAAGGPEAALALGPGTERLGRATLVVPVAGADELALAVQQQTAAFGEPAEDRAFAGHVTLGRW